MKRWTRRQIIIAVAIATSIVSFIGFITIYFGGTTGADASSYATQPNGVAAWADLLAGQGHPVTRLRVRPSQTALDPAATLVVLAPPVVVADDVDAIRSFVLAGGHLVTSDQNLGWLGSLLDDPPFDPVRASPATIAVATTPGVFAGVRRLAVGPVRWEHAGGALPLVRDDSGVAVTVTRLGAGQVVALAHHAALTNAALGDADNAAFALAVAGEPGRTVLFAETYHGYGVATGIAAVPAGWKAALGGLLLSSLVLIWARVRRVGPPDRPHRALAPPRVNHVHGVADLLTRAKDPAAAIEVLRTRGLRLLDEREGRVVTDDGAAADDRAALSDVGPFNDSKLLQVGAVVARLERQRGDE
jgi:hypothetical protein